MLHDHSGDSTRGLGPGGHPNRRRRRTIIIVVGGLLLLALLATVVIIRSTGSGGDAGAAAERARCARQAAGLPDPWRSSPAVHGAAPESPYSKAPQYVPPYPQASQAAAEARRSGDSARAGRLQRIAQQPRAVWFTDPSVTGQQLSDQVSDVVSAARRQNRVLTLVVYTIPLRDCGGYSAGGAASGQAYLKWIRSFVFGLQQGGAAAGPGVSVILEPDALGLMDRLPDDRQAERYALLRDAVVRVGAVPGAAVYLDAGTVNWLTPTEAARRLSRAGIVGARGFALNVSNFNRAETVVGYGRAIFGQVGWKRFVVDTGRSGNGPAPGRKAWCNPSGRALGPTPAAAPTDNVDAYLWVKPPGESDGDCGRSEPAAGQFWPDYADALARNAGW